LKVNIQLELAQIAMKYFDYKFMMKLKLHSAEKLLKTATEIKKLKFLSFLLNLVAFLIVWHLSSKINVDAIIIPFYISFCTLSQ